jgi:hypothetical protein
MQRPAVTSKVGQLGKVLTELLALYSDPGNAAAFARNESGLSTALTKHQLLCTALLSNVDQSPPSRKENRRHQA